MTRKRSPNLSTARVAEVVDIILRMPERPTWERVIQVVSTLLKADYTRQTLHGHDAILLAFQDRKRGRPAKHGAVRRRTVDERVEALQEEVLRLRSVEARLKEKFVRWANNAHARGVTEAMLEQPLPTLDRS